MNIIKPSQEYIKSYYEACCEMWNSIHDNYIIHNPNEFDKWKEHIVQDFENQKNGIGLPDGFVPSETYWIVDNDKYIGTINIRPSLNDNLRTYGGNAGVVIRNSKQNSIYGKIAIEFIFKRAKELKLKTLLMTCEEKNRASWRGLAQCKPIKVEKDRIKLYGKDTNIRRYYFDIANQL